MSIRHLIAVGTLLTLTAPAFSQTWEFGLVGGWGHYNSREVTGAASKATAGFKDGPAVGVAFGHNMYRHLGGELRYGFQWDNLKVSSSATKFDFAGRSHVIHYDFVFHFTPTGSHIRPYVAAGGGVKIYQGTGVETSVQPLSTYAVLTKTKQTEGLLSLAGGVKVAASKHLSLRFELRDYSTPFPLDVITPVPPAEIKGWVHDLMALAGISYTW